MGDFKPKHFYTVQELTELFGLTRQTIYKEVKSGKIRAYVIAGEYRIPTSALEELIYTPEPEPEAPKTPMKEAAPAVLTEEEREQRKEDIKKAHEFNNYINETHPEEEKEGE